MSSRNQSAGPRDSSGQRSASPLGPKGKGTTAPAKLSHRQDDSVELKSIRPEDDLKTPLPIEEDIMQLARLGEIGAIQKLFESGKFDARYEDEEGITPLHWAAINNQYALCKFLVEAGADVNAKGGESVATPAMWASQRCHYYVVNLLLENGADPLLTDVQGYNILHLATIDGNAFLLVLLLHQELPVDVTDPHGHTSLMWAAYKGFPACVDLFLRWGANVNAMDEGGLTPLHWALVKGSQPCIQKIIEYGADRFAKTNDGKSPATVAQEMKTTRAYYRALQECGYDGSGNLRTLPLGLAALMRKKNVVSKFFFVWPFLMVFVSLWLLSNMVIYAAVPMMLVAVLAMQWVTQQVAKWGPADYRNIQKTPFMAGIFAGSLFLVGLRWALYVLPATYSSHGFLNFFFAAFYSLTTYFYASAMVEDPGHVPKLGSRNQQRNVITELFETWRFDEENFCVYCMIRKPLRSKHCRRCARCVAKHDHHCPWIDNCVAANNFRHFFLYILCLEIGIILFIQLAIAYITGLPRSTQTECNILPPELCDHMYRDTFTIVLTLWIALQLIWVTLLFVVQIIQISRNQTTYENMKGHSIDHATPASQAITSAITAGTTSLDAAGLSNSGQGPNPAIPPAQPQPRQRDSCLTQWKKLLGIDTFITTAQGGFHRHEGQAARSKNPYSRGIVTNCRDFWCDSAPYFGKREPGSAMLGGEIVNYNRMYDVPLRLRTGGGMAYRSLPGEEAGDV
ncbi:palmitoyltransferase akr1 [Arachnomyces sp. PD_36]|nr:palmitoyltransferase akr1 [Arachnomyces sp. PD_36]